MDRAVGTSCLYGAYLLCECLGDDTFMFSPCIYKDVRTASPLVPGEALLLPTTRHIEQVMEKDL